MQSNRPRDTAPEVALRSALHRAGLRFFKNRRPTAGLRCEADIVFPRPRVAVFVDGCFWHSCPQHATFPKTNAEWWARKLEATRQRDRDNECALAAAGWTVVRVWEHEATGDAVARIREILTAAPALGGQRGGQRRGSWVITQGLGGNRTARQGMATDTCGNDSSTLQAGGQGFESP
jgi:DNA mismatch endonuclease, patch repair protein